MKGLKKFQLKVLLDYPDAADFAQLAGEMNLGQSALARSVLRRWIAKRLKRCPSCGADRKEQE